MAASIIICILNKNTCQFVGSKRVSKSQRKCCGPKRGPEPRISGARPLLVGPPARPPPLDINPKTKNTFVKHILRESGVVDRDFGRREIGLRLCWTQGLLSLSRSSNARERERPQHKSAISPLLKGMNTQSRSKVVHTWVLTFRLQHLAKDDHKVPSQGLRQEILLFPPEPRWVHPRGSPMLRNAPKHAKEMHSCAVGLPIGLLGWCDTK